MLLAGSTRLLPSNECRIVLSKSTNRRPMACQCYSQSAGAPRWTWVFPRRASLWARLEPAVQPELAVPTPLVCHPISLGYGYNNSFVQNFVRPSETHSLRHLSYFDRDRGQPGRMSRPSGSRFPSIRARLGSSVFPLNLFALSLYIHFLTLGLFTFFINFNSDKWENFYKRGSDREESMLPVRPRVFSPDCPHISALFHLFCILQLVPVFLVSILALLTHFYFCILHNYIFIFPQPGLQ